MHGINKRYLNWLTPFLQWLPSVNNATPKADISAALTGAAGQAPRIPSRRGFSYKKEDLPYGKIMAISSKYNHTVQKLSVVSGRISRSILILKEDF